MPAVPYPAVDIDGAVLGSDIGFAGTPWENFRHIVDGNRNATTEETAIMQIDRNQTWQLQIRLGLNDPDVVMQAAQFVPGHDYTRKLPKSGNPVEWRDVFVWPSVLGNRLGLTIYDTPSIIQYFNSGAEPWPIIEHAEGNVAGGA